MPKYIATLLVCAGILNAGSPALFDEAPRPHRTHHVSRTLWKLSLGALAASEAADSLSSWGYREANPNLCSGTGLFGDKAAASKGAVVMGVALGQWMLLRKLDHSPLTAGFLAGSNAGIAATVARLAARNYQIQSAASH
ncbi:MAG TPA: hypothetical protein VMU19_09065 [Bryobacteraceae bacterium]|nr:hypothetical protein [Bryobacteraceae bacterium]